MPSDGGGDWRASADATNVSPGAADDPEIKWVLQRPLIRAEAAVCARISRPKSGSRPVVKYANCDAVDQEDLALWVGGLQRTQRSSRCGGFRTFAVPSWLLSTYR